jgi:hypothetical protein
MGEITDDVIGNIAEFGDAFDAEEEGVPNIGRFVCRYCGSGGLYWKIVNDKWRLCEKNLNGDYVVHTCKEYLKDKT